MRIHNGNKSPLTTVLAGSSIRSTERFANNAGDINASSKADLIGRIIELSAAISSGQFSNEVREVATAAERQERLVAAFTSPDLSAMAELGSSISGDVSDTMTRSGFMRRFLARGNVAQGAYPRVRVQDRNVQAVVATGPAQVAPQNIRDKYITPSEFDVVANIFIENREFNQGSPDLLQEKYDEALEAIMVAEDRTFKRLSDVAAGLLNAVTVFSGAFTPVIAAKVQTEVALWNLPTMSLLISQDLLQDMNNGTAWNNVLDPVSQLEILQTGRLGVVYGMDLVTDGFRDQRLRVLNNGEVYCYTVPGRVGSYTDRGPVQSEVRTNHGDKVGRGWFMSESISVAVASAKGVARARRV